MLTKIRIGSQDVGITIFKLRHFIPVCQQRGLSFNSSVNDKSLTEKVKTNLFADPASESKTTTTIIIIIIIIIICPNKINIHVAEMLSSNAFVVLYISKYEVSRSNSVRGMSQCLLFLYLYVALCRQRNCDWPVPHPGGSINFVDRRFVNPPKLRSGTTLACRAIEIIIQEMLLFIRILLDKEIQNLNFLAVLK